MGIPFIKYEGCGNDFVLLDFTADTKTKKLHRQIELSSFKNWMRKLADRHFGVGADQIILILPGNQKRDPSSALRAMSQVVFFNADGSRAEICGNGLRAAALYLVESGNPEKKKPGSKSRIDIGMQTDTGFRIAQVSKVRWESGARGGLQRGASRRVAPAAFSGSVQVEMGVPRLLGRKSLQDPSARRTANAAGVGVTYEAVNLGNPHAIFFESQQARGLKWSGEARLRLIGPEVESARDFPNRTNVEWVLPVRRDLLRIWIWERGAGPTLACGSGACASAVAAMQRGLVDLGTVEVQMPGGSVWVSWDGRPESPCFLAGPVNRVFEGVGLGFSDPQGAISSVLIRP
jgi:diaminopimelate epimerase